MVTRSVSKRRKWIGRINFVEGFIDLLQIFWWLLRGLGHLIRAIFEHFH